MIMGLITAALMFVLGLLIIPNIVLPKKPRGRAIMDRWVPWLGLAGLGWGVLVIVDATSGFGQVWRMPVSWAAYLIGGVVLVGLGLLLGTSLILRFRRPGAPHDSSRSNLEPGLARVQGAWALWAMILSVVLVILLLMSVVPVRLRVKPEIGQPRRPAPTSLLLDRGAVDKDLARRA
ncbi:MAG: hypothetical protein KJ621_18740 [Proteobacteria bacterium]|nr:hypothetical protein [Pseudomonadota bacterium]MBU1740840.1 hypothetical protein [Pseudomonadota bacterium]